MYYYTHPHRAAYAELLDQYLVVFLGTILSFFGGIIYLANQHDNNVIMVYLVISTLTLIFVFLLLYFIKFKYIKYFNLEISETGLSINSKFVPFSDLQEICVTYNKCLEVICKNHLIYKINKSILNYEEIISKVSSLTVIKAKQKNINDKLFYAIELLIFVVFMFANIPYIVIPLGLFLLFISIKNLISNIQQANPKLNINICINIFLVCFICYKLIQNIKLLLI